MPLTYFILGFHGWNKLAQSISMNFFHNSASRGNASRSTDIKHEFVKAKLMSIIMEDDTVRRVVWIHGSSHTSEIAQSITDLCAQSNIQPTSFFGEAITSGIDEHYSLFIPIIAYQFCLLIPEARLLVGQAVECDPAILSRSPLDQVRDLIIIPLTRLVQSQKFLQIHHRPVIILDAIHKFAGKHQRHITYAILAAADQIPLPATFMVFSKPSGDINAAFRCHRDHSFTEIAVSGSGVYASCKDLYAILPSVRFMLSLNLLLFCIATISLVSLFKHIM